MIEVFGARPFQPMVENAAEAMGMEPQALTDLVIENLTGPGLPFVLFEQDEQIMIGSLIPNGFEVLQSMLIERRRQRGRA